MADTPDTLATFKADLGVGRGSITVNGEDISGQVVAGRVEFAHGEIPRLTVQLNAAGGPIEGRGIVQIASNDSLADAAAVVRALDPVRLREQASAQGGLGTDYTAALLQLIADQIEGLG